MWFTAETSSVFEMQKFHLSYNIFLPRRVDSWLPSPSPKDCTVSVQSYADVITKFSRIDRLPNFLNYDSPLTRARALVELL